MAHLRIHLGQLIICISHQSCVTNYPKFSGLKQEKCVSHFSTDEEWGSHPAGWFRLRVFHEAVKMLAALQSPEAIWAAR